MGGLNLGLNLGAAFGAGIGHEELDRVLGHISNVFQCYFTWRMDRTPDAMLHSWKHHDSVGLGNFWIGSW